MRSGIFVLILYLVTAPAAHADHFRFLGTKVYKDAAGNTFYLPEGADVEIPDPKADPMMVQYQDPLSKSLKELPVPHTDLTTYFDSDSDSFRSFFSPGWDALNGGGQNKTSCPQLPSSACPLTDHLEDTRREALAMILLSCEPDSGFPLVKRADPANCITCLDVAAYKKACAAHRADPAKPLPAPPNPGTWAAPKDYPDCAPAEAAILRSNEQKKNKAYLASCPANDSPSMAGLGLQPEPNCMLTMDKGQVKKIVLHDTEGSPTSSMAGLYCDYAPEDYNDMPYHYVIGQDPATKKWRVYEGRNTRYQGAHVRAGLNSDSIGIAIAGDYNPSGPSAQHPFFKSTQPPAEALQLLQSLVENLKHEYPNMATIEGHGEALAKGDHCFKDCPGPGNEFLVQRLREKFFPGAAQ